jgi:hypothetical protein
MQFSENPIPVASKCIPWNKGKLTGAKPPLRPKHVWSIAPSFKWQTASAIWRYSIWPSTASCAVAMSSLSKSRTLPRMDTLLIAQRCVRRKLAGRCGLSSPNKPARRFPFCRAASARPGPLDPTICASRRRLERHRARSLPVRYAFAASDQGHPNLPPYRQPAGRPVAAGPYEDREHGSLSWHRGR